MFEASGMNRQAAFLARVKQRLGKAEALPALPDALLELDVCPTTTTVGTPISGLVTRLEAELTAVGGQVVCVASPAAATAYIEALVEDRNLHHVVRWSSELLDQLEIDATLLQHGVKVQTAPSQPDSVSCENRQTMRHILAQADLGISGVTYAIAETGTLALAAHAGQMRGVSLLPPVHIAVARSEQIVATLADCLAQLQAAGDDLQHNLTSCISFITGPSRTGDIELNLTVGVHGPGELHLVILDDT
jgi:L-lactate dehydrogenase complex protein LldG